MDHMNKNETYEITIEDFTKDGEGVGHIEGMAVFVKDTVPGDVAVIKIIKLKKNYAYGRLMEVITPSRYRVEPVCDKARQCGGCIFQHVSYERQLEFKLKHVRDCLKRIGGIENADELITGICGMDEPYHYRNKAQFPVGRDKEGKVITGFYAGHSHNIIDTEKCFIQAKVNEEILACVRKYIEDYNITTYSEEEHKGLVRHVLTRVGFTTGEIMVCLVINGKKLPHSEVLVERLKGIEGMTSICLNVNTEKTNKILGNECITLWGEDYITDYLGDVKFRISPLSFYQVNPVQTEKLYGKALEYAGLTGSETVWDVYCGIGTISLFLAKKAKHVHGVEIVPEAIEDAELNSSINDITNTTFYVGKAEEVLPREYEKNGIHADVIVVDPPRKGCDIKALETIIKMEPKRIVYVSCDPATLARDVKWLSENGYELKCGEAYDQFCFSGHVETVVQLVNIGVKPDYTVRL
ncbi:MAG: 23S rRNA (uracil(1939)-C(5))-methyltransferase RlmD [Lachnospiraceae bacterium]|nr:23S rRNA (uracil(1939)-C(5))-methyltransferase RlmD [Lachnospiraceae bacterium]